MRSDSSGVDPMAACQAKKTDFRGWQEATLENGLVKLVAVPDIGGRLMAYDLGNYSYLYVDPSLAGKLFTKEENLGDGSLAAWKNYGGDKTWPAPQGWDNDNQWHGPPDPVLDSGRYALEAFGTTGDEALVEMVSPPDGSTGLQITREITLKRGSTRVNLELIFTNISDRKIHWSIWDVVQLRAERRLPDGRLDYEPQCSISAPLNPESRFPGGFNVMFGAENNPQWKADPERGLFLARYLWEIGKVSLDSPGDWIAFSNNASANAFAARYTYHPDLEYPDEGATVECWTVGKGKVANLDYENSDIYLMEVEVLSPLYEFQPGEAHSFVIEWGVCKCPGPIQSVSEAGCVGETLPAARANGRLRLQGKFGVFEPGDLYLVWKDPNDQVIETIHIGAVTPLAPIHIDDAFDRPPQATGLELNVIASVDRRGRKLATLKL